LFCRCLAESPTVRAPIERSDLVIPTARRGSVAATLVLGRYLRGVTRPAGEPRSLDERDLAGRVATLSLEQKVRLLTGADCWSLHPEPAVGLRRVVLSDGPAGVRGERWDERDTSANVPSPTALAATWDERLIEDLGGLLAFEARRKGVDVLLAPTLNLHRTPYGGRHFECFSEDPLLAARIGVAYVRGVQRGGVAATVKHFVANDSETERMTLDARLDERTLRELYLAPFEATVREGGAWALMASYNALNGQPMTESALLRSVLQGEFGFDGLVMSDWSATHSTEASARAALDLVMPGPEGPWGDALLAAVRRGDVDQATIDEKVVRILRLGARVGALEGSTATPPRHHDDAEIAALVRRAASAAFVLAANPTGVLPLDRHALGRLAVIGPNAAVARTLGGGSATVFPPYTVSPLEGLRAALGPAVEVQHRVGVLASDRIPVAPSPALHRPGGGTGVEVRFVGRDGAILGSEQRPGCAFSWRRGLDFDSSAAWVEVHTVIAAAEAGTHTIAASGVGRFRLWLGGKAVLDEHLELAPGADSIEGLVRPPQAARTVHLARGEEIEVILAHEIGSATSDVGDLDVRFALNLLSPHGTDDEEIDRAASLARDVDVAVVVVGTTEEVESEGFDRRSLSLPGRQDQLVRRVVAVNPKTVVVVNSGAPVLLPWADEVAAVLLVWFPGQEFGNALADVLLGLAEPGGRLPTTWPSTVAGLPSTLPVGGALSYDEGLSIGYRLTGDRPPNARYPFGHGLGFSTWEYVSIAAPREAAPGCDVRPAVALRNTGTRRSREVVQLYASRPDSDIQRPARWLIGFAVVEADPGLSATATITATRRAFEHWDVEAGAWTVEPGMFTLAAGGSSATLPVSAEITIHP
jgi:beta-glucosidase